MSAIITDYSIEVLQKTEKRISICYNNATAGHIPKGIPNQYVKRNVSILIVIETLSIIAKK